MTRRRDVEVGAEIVDHGLARGVFVRSLHPVVPVVDAPEIERQPLAQVTENDLQPRQLIEQAAADQAQRMQSGFGGKAPGRTKQPGMPVVKRRGPGHGRAGMEVERNVELGERMPERAIGWQVVVNGLVAFRRLRIAVHQCASESEMSDAALQLLYR